MALSQASFHLDDRETATQLLDELASVSSTMAVLHPGITVLSPVAELRAAVLGCLGRLDDAIAEAVAATDLCARTGCVAVGVRSNALLAVLLRRRHRAGDDLRLARLEDEIQGSSAATGAEPPAWYTSATR